MYAKNISEYQLSVLLAPTAIVVFFACVIYCGFLFLFKSISKAAIVASPFILVALSYTRLLAAIKKYHIKLGDFVITSDKILLFLLILSLVLIMYWVIRFSKFNFVFNKVFTVFSLVLLVFTLLEIVPTEIKTGRLLRQNTGQQKKILAANVTPFKKTPDIYYIIFDRYAGEKALREQYSFDNSKLLNYLNEKGFYVASNSSANYPKTFLSLASSLNFMYLDELTEKTNGGKSKDQSIVTPLIQNSQVLQFLKSKGYTIINSGSWWEPTRENKYADINYILKYGGYLHVDEFTGGFLNMTFAAPILREILKDPIAVSENPMNNDHRRRILFQFGSVEEISKISGPKFVFMHFLAPHDPFVFDKECKPVPEEITFKRSLTENYLDQLQCINKKIKLLVETILSNSTSTPIIVLQSDEGPLPLKDPLPAFQSWGTAEDPMLKEKFPILNAYYLPNSDYATLYPKITPVNTFRIIFNEYFNTSYELLPDRNYIFQDENNYYRFSDVTLKLE